MKTCGQTSGAQSHLEHRDHSVHATVTQRSSCPTHSIIKVIKCNLQLQLPKTFRKGLEIKCIFKSICSLSPSLVIHPVQYLSIG